VAYQAANLELEAQAGGDLIKIVWNPTWRCNLKCEYCWVRQVGWHNTNPGERSWQEWLMAFVKYLPERTVMDISGGEPLLFKGLHSLLGLLVQERPDIQWAMTTNLTPDAWERFYAHPVPKCVVINVSAHAITPNFERVNLLQQRYSVRVNRVEHERAPIVRGDYSRITYEDWSEGPAVDGVVRLCDAGTRHVVINPTGDIYHCSIEPRLGLDPVGNIFEGRFPKGGTRLCQYGCGTCYTDSPGAWFVRMRPAANQ
jgi:MoaA/NifB/PqqE/SkfB family radical SAM enzyme